MISGEDSEKGALREAIEETGIDHTDSKRTFIKTVKRLWDDGEKGWHGDLCDIWLFEADFPIEKVTLLPGETTDAKWVSQKSWKSFPKKDFSAVPEYSPH